MVILFLKPKLHLIQRLDFCSFLFRLNKLLDLVIMPSPYNEVVVVDDDPRVRKLIGLSLEELGVRADFYDAPFELLTVVKDSQPKLILLDLMMPQMDGVDSCRRLREIGSTAFICIVSALRDDQMVRDALSAGANRYVGKSEVFEILEDLVRASSIHLDVE